MRGGGEEQVRLELRRHPIVLARPFAAAAALAAGASALALVGWPATVGAAAALAVAAAVALRAVWRWERTRVRVTTERLEVSFGTLRRRSASVSLRRVGTVELEQGLAGRVLGYGTLTAGDLEIPFVPEPRRVTALLDRLGHG